MPNHSSPYPLGVLLAGGLVLLGSFPAFGALSFSNPIHFVSAANPAALAIADLDGDGDRDVAAVSTGGDLTLLFNNGAGGFPTRAIHPALWTSDAIDIAAGDLDQDGDFDLAVALLELNGTIAVLHNQGDGTFANPIFHQASSFAKAVTIAPLDGDGFPDFTMVSNSFKATVFLNGGNGSYAVNGHYGEGYVSNAIQCADLDGDGDQDIAYANAGIRNVTVLKNNGDGTFGLHAWYDTGSYPTDLVLADFDQDGDNDIAAPNYYDDTVAILRNQGNATFAASQAFPGVADPYGIAAGDLDLDGDPDIVVANMAGNNIGLFENSASSLSPPQFKSSGQGPKDVAIADLNNDGLPDVAVANGSQSTVAILLNATPVTGVGEDIVPSALFRLSSPAPNPTRTGVTTFLFSPRVAPVRLDVFDVNGRHVRNLIDGVFSVGTHPIRWDGSDSRGKRVAAGMYWLRLEVVEEEVIQQRVAVVR